MTTLPAHLKDKLTDTTLLSILQNNTNDAIDLFKMERISEKEKDTLSRIFGQIPVVAQTIALNQSFRIVMPPGVFGKLLTHVKDPAMKGLYTTAITSGTSNRIIGQAGITRMSGFFVPAVVWSFLSFITGQFFLTHIKNNTDSIFKELRRILFFLVAKEEGALGSRIEFISYAISQFGDLFQNTEMRLATLVNTQRVNIESLASLKLWVHSMDNELDEIKKAIENIRRNQTPKEELNKIFNVQSELRRHTNRALASYQCYTLGSVLEFQLGSMFETEFLEQRQRSLSGHSKEIEEALSKANKLLNEVSMLPILQTTNVFQAGEIQTIRDEFNDFSICLKTSKDTANRYINTIKSLDEHGLVLIYHDKAIYKPKAV